VNAAAATAVPADKQRAASLARLYAGADANTLLAAMIREEFSGSRIALVSSFGTEAAVLLHLVSQADPATPVVFLDTGKLFGETLRYRDTLVGRLGLTDVRSIEPDPAAVEGEDNEGVLWLHDADSCCRIRKVEPLARALKPFAAWINGRKRFQNDDRAAIPPVEWDGERIKVNPLAEWNPADVAAYFERHDLPRHPLEADGYRSIGCMPCTDRVAPDEDPRAGRWRGKDKTECGIHLPRSVRED
jgi:phosphoadenosine phosphosulfate reductase